MEIILWVNHLNCQHRRTGCLETQSVSTASAHNQLCVFTGNMADSLVSFHIRNWMPTKSHY